MAIRLRTNQDIDQYIRKVLQEAQHHGGNVDQVITLLSNAVRARLNLSHDDVQVYERNGQMARTCWVTLNGNRWAFSYNYGQQKIDLRQGSVQGATVDQFDNNSTAAQIHAAVARM